MTENSAPEPLRPLKTWSHLAKQRRRPSEYEIVSTNLHFSTNDPVSPFDLDADLPMNVWYKKYRNASPLEHDDWDAFRDPDEIVYRTYNIIQDGQEAYVEGLLDEFQNQEHDRGHDPLWLETLTRLYTPGRYPVHAVQMGSAYLFQIAPASTISNCAAFQGADALRWLSNISYRTKELADAWPDRGFGANERDIWERDAAWQGFRELMEKALVAYDWGEAFTALNLVAKPALDEACLRQLSLAARRNNDMLLALLADALLRDGERHRRWTAALVDFAIGNPANKAVLGGWVEKWAPLGDAAIDAYCRALPDSPTAAADAKKAVSAFHAGLGISA